MTLRVSVESEIAPLEQVLVHRPGDEVARMTQRDLGALLFDDILSPAEAVREHDLMTDILRGAGATVVDVLDLLEAALERAGSAEREALLAEVCEQLGVHEIAAELGAIGAAELGRALVTGVRWDDVAGAPRSLARVRSAHEGGDTWALPPIPNLMFMRDPCVAVGRDVVVGRMATAARAREPLLVAFALRHSGELERPSVLFDTAGDRRGPRYRRFEGGDVLVLSPRVLMIGCSERTSAQTIERVAHEALFAAGDALERVYVVFMPERRTVMHFDTILTHIDASLFLGYAPAIVGPEALPVAVLEKSRAPRLLRGAGVLDVLCDELGRKTQLVPCGGDDRLHQEREQWTDGANALCLAPGRIMLYARNVYTIEALARHGFEEVQLHMVQPPEQRAELVAAGMARPRTVFSFAAGELSRARGGGRCLTMPLCRAG